MTTTQEQAPVEWETDAQRAEALEVSNKRLRNALKPFAQLGALSAFHKDGYVRLRHGVHDGTSINYKCFRDANDAMCFDDDLRQPRARLTEEERGHLKMAKILINAHDTLGYECARTLVDVIDRLTAAPAQQVTSVQNSRPSPGVQPIAGAIGNAGQTEGAAHAAQSLPQVTREEIVAAMCEAQWRCKRPDYPNVKWSKVRPTDDTEWGHFRRKAEISADAILSLPALRGLVKESE